MTGGGRCYCTNLDVTEINDLTEDNFLYTFYEIVPGCSCEGHFMDAGVKRECLPGTYNADSCRSKCTECPRGQYQPSSGAMRCLLCPKGYFQDGFGRSTCKVCRNTCPTEGNNGVGVVKECEEGSIEDNTQCARCDSQHPTRSGQTFSKHPEDEYLVLRVGSFAANQVVLNRPTECSFCTPGQYLQGDCKTCPAGYYGSIPPGSDCTKCPAGYYQDVSSQTNCILCASGHYQTQEAQTGCVACPVGFARQAYTPTGSGIMQRQPAENGCLPCGSLHGKTIDYADIGISLPSKSYSIGGDVPAPGCVFCNQYQDESGQEHCKICNLHGVNVLNTNGEYTPYSYLDVDGNPDKLGACKYVQNVKRLQLRANDMTITQLYAEIPLCTPGQIYMNEGEKRTMVLYPYCLYSSLGTTFARGHPDYNIITIDDFGTYRLRISAFQTQYIQAFSLYPCNTMSVDYFTGVGIEPCIAYDPFKPKSVEKYVDAQYYGYAPNPIVQKTIAGTIAEINNVIQETGETAGGFLNTVGGFFSSIFRL